MNKLLVIYGPTAVGKTALGIKLAEKFSGEIISADSRQVYQGMDVGTGKEITKSEKLKMKKERFWAGKQIGYYLVNGVKIWLYDVVRPDQLFNVADYHDLAWGLMGDIWKRGKLPIIAGGTGFYIKAVVDGVESLGIEPDWELREKLSNYSTSELSDHLKQIDPQRWEKMNDSDRKNPRRLVRAIEITQQRKKILHFDTAQYHSGGRRETPSVFFIGLMAPYRLLYERIDRRVEERVKIGVVGEVENLLKIGCGWSLPSMSAMGYREFRDFFEKKASLDQVIQRWKFDEHGYARRQLTWFKKDPRIHWFDITEPDWESKVEELLKRWYNLRK